MPDERRRTLISNSDEEPGISTIQAECDDGQDGRETRDKHNPRADAANEKQPREIGGRKGPEPTRFGDWEKNGRCIDF